MKASITIIVFLYLQFGYTQELKTYSLRTPDSEEISDLYFLKEEIQNKRLVMLGEQTHQYGTFFEVKARIIKYLHQELGYTTIAMETSMYDLWKMNKEQGFDPIKFNETVYGVWSNTKEFQRLVNYIDKHQLKVIGFDSQISNTDQFIDDFFDYCEDNDLEIKIDQEDMAIVMQGILDAYSFDEYDMEFLVYEKELERIIKKIASLKNTDHNYYWKQFSKNILAVSRDAYKNSEEIKSYHFISAQHNIRDAQMADNVLSYMQRNPSEKIILWADNIHIINAVEATKEPILKEFISMGSY